MTTVSNASPLINLSRIDKLDLLRQLFGELLIPGAVWEEVSALFTIKEKQKAEPARPL